MGCIICYEGVEFSRFNLIQNILGQSLHNIQALIYFIIK